MSWGRTSKTQSSCVRVLTRRECPIRVLYQQLPRMGSQIRKCYDVSPSGDQGLTALTRSSMSYSSGSLTITGLSSEHIVLLTASPGTASQGSHRLQACGNWDQSPFLIGKEGEAQRLLRLLPWLLLLVLLLWPSWGQVHARASPGAAVGPVSPAQEGAAFSHSVAFSVKLCVSTASCCSHSAPRASLPPLSTAPPPPPTVGTDSLCSLVPVSGPQLHRSSQALLGQDCTGSLSQPLLTRPPSLSASPGTTARLTCTLSRDIGVGGSNIDWIQQQPGSPPRCLPRFSSDSEKHQGSGVPSRFSGSKDASANEGLLRISGLQAEAEADSHWATAQGSGRSYRSSQPLREGGSETKIPGSQDLVCVLISLRNLPGDTCREESSAGRSLLEQEK
ncbi:uncharacterized protein LOC118356273 [Zalophus californianus]|uniref:Uncharacterized protein LOC118356273 n=1 Tax=Zalophus californianus TaxID=9704 RepID=A0A6P9FDM6_ZALCA|nr:uncharacterized protein LOC118356273 [Zalophus californianus]